MYLPRGLNDHRNLHDDTASSLTLSIIAIKSIINLEPENLFSRSEQSHCNGMFTYRQVNIVSIDQAHCDSSEPSERCMYSIVRKDLHQALVAGIDVCIATCWCQQTQA